jgi:hypothetical protein
VQITSTAAAVAVNNVVSGNYIGTDVTGAIAIPNSSNGVNLTGGQTFNTTISGNVISGNNSGGILINTTVLNTQVLNNLVGTTATGMLALGNRFSGVNSNGSGGTFANNVISGNGTATTFGSGINITGGTANVITGNRIGTDVTGTIAIANSDNGVSISNSNNNVIGGAAPGARNITSGNGAFGKAGAGIAIFGPSANNQVIGNYAGVDITGTVALGNANNGIFTSGTNTIIGGNGAAGEGNLVSGNGFISNGAGVAIGAGGTSNRVMGNRIGTNAAGTAAIANANGGVSVFNASNNLVGGLTPNVRNLISGNGRVGFSIYAVSIIGNGTGNRVSGNFIGTDVTGTALIRNIGDGIGLLDTTTSTLVGGPEAGAGNLLAGNVGGIVIGGTSSSNLMQGNFIGSNTSGVPLVNANTVGIWALGAGINNRIGGGSPGEGNVIAGNLSEGVRITGTTGTSVRGNSIFSNGTLGIDVGGGGLTANDTGDGDAGPNNFQNYPIVTQAGTGSTLVDGTLNSTPNTTFTLDFYANTACDPSGFGEGQRYLGSTPVTTDATGNAVFRATLAALSAVGELVTGTATDPSGNTSEFSACQPIGSAGRIGGRVTDAITSAAIADVAVQIFNAGGGLVTTSSTDPSGNYATTLLDSGSYFVKTLNTQGYIDLINVNIPCAAGACPPVTTGTAVPVVAGVRSPVDFRLSRPTATYVFTGTVTSVDPSLASVFDTSMTLTGTFTYDTRLAGSLSGTEESGFRDYADGLTNLVMTVGDYTAAPPFGTNIFDGVQVANNWFGSDRFVASGRLSGPNFNGFAPLGFISLDDTAQNAFSNTQVTEVGNLSGWTLQPGRSGSWYLAFSAGGGAPSISGSITSIAYVPPVSAVLVNNGAFSGGQSNTANIPTQQLFEDFTVTQNSVITGINWQQHDQSGSTYVNTQVLVYSGLPFNGAPVFSSNIVASRAANTTGTLFAQWEGFDYSIGGLHISLSPGTYWIGLNSNLTGGRPGWDNTTGGPNTIPGFRLVNVANPAPGTVVAGNLAFRLEGYVVP